jgi:uncharacterized protein (DUF433 family)
VFLHELRCGKIVTVTISNEVSCPLCRGGCSKFDISPATSTSSRISVEERNGGYYVAGTRVSLDSIAQCFNEGLSPEAILGEFETLTLAQIFGAIAFYLENQPAIDSYRVRQMQRFEAVRRSANPLPAGLRQRLDSARDQIHSTHSE